MAGQERKRKGIYHNLMRGREEEKIFLQEIIAKLITYKILHIFDWSISRERDE